MRFSGPVKYINAMNKGLGPLTEIICQLLIKFFFNSHHGANPGQHTVLTIQVKLTILTSQLRKEPAYLQSLNLYSYINNNDVHLKSGNFERKSKKLKCQKQKHAFVKTSTLIPQSHRIFPDTVKVQNR